MSLQTATGAKFSTILGIGGYRPRRVVDNAEICTLIDSTDEWIQTRSGIRERRWASEDETIEMMSLAAARKAVQRAGINAGQIDTVIVSTVTHLYQTPSAAATIASELGAKSAAAFDISAACAGFCYAAAMADSFIRTGASTYVLIIGVERLSDLTNRNDRSTAFLFADGAGAAVIGPSDTAGIGPVVWGSDGDQAGLITQTEAWDRAWDRAEAQSSDKGGSTPCSPPSRCCGWRATRSSSGRATPWRRPPPRPWTGRASGPRTSTSSCRTRPTCASPTPCSAP